jgi:hypothetical protein
MDCTTAIGEVENLHIYKGTRIIRGFGGFGVWELIRPPNEPGKRGRLKKGETPQRAEGEPKKESTAVRITL